MDSLLISTGVVALAEMGDKTQLLAFILAARFSITLDIGRVIYWYGYLDFDS
jgi:putative Ca2+/H+ antiporter (TMEM165/GDT1 family)